MIGSKNIIFKQNREPTFTVSLEISICKVKQLILHTQDKENIFYFPLASIPNYQENELVYVRISAVAVSLK